MSNKKNKPTTSTRLKRQILSRPRLIRAILGVCIVLFTGQLVTTWIISKLPIPSAGTVKQYVSAFSDPESQLPAYKGRTNILLLGVGGAGHEGSNLTDSMMVISVASDGSDATMLSLPRDIWIPSMQAKLNTAFYYGEQYQPGTGGMTLAKAAVSEVIDQPIHYAVLIDFQGFEKLVDTLGGIEVDVENAFTDEKYPIPGKENAYPESDRYETISFQAGPQLMDGITTLKFVRSRNAQGPEGTDLARSSRQKRVLAGIQRRLIATNVIFNRSKLEDIYAVVQDSIAMDIPTSAWPAFIRLGTQIQPSDVRPLAIPIYLEVGEGNTDKPEDALLIHPPISEAQQNQWVLTPTESDFTQIHLWIDCQWASRQQC